MKTCKTIFMGTSRFAVPALEKLVECFSVAAVVTRKDKPGGRGKKTVVSPVKQRAVELGLPVLQPEKLDRQTITRLSRLDPDLIVTAAYGLILPEELLKTPRWGCLNIHPSLLPRYRGAAPIQRALMRGEKVTGVSIYLMDEGMDTGPLLKQKRMFIKEEEDAGGLSERLALEGASLLIEVIPIWIKGQLSPRPQQGKPIYAPPISREEERIDWQRQADQIQNQIRGLSPAPGAYTYWKGKRLKIWQAKALPGEGDPGMVISVSPFRVATGKGLLEVKKLQLEGKRAITSEEFCRGYRVELEDYVGGAGSADS